MSDSSESFQPLCNPCHSSHNLLQGKIYQTMLGIQILCTMVSRPFEDNCEHIGQQLANKLWFLSQDIDLHKGSEECTIWNVGCSLQEDFPLLEHSLQAAFNISSASLSSWTLQQTQYWRKWSRVVLTRCPHQLCTFLSDQDQLLPFCSSLCLCSVVQLGLQKHHLAPSAGDLWLLYYIQ